MVAVYIYAGLRREEALWLTRKDISLSSGKYRGIYVQAKTVNGEFWEPKTKVNRAVPISRTLRSYLERYQVKIVPGGWYFPSRKGKYWDPDNFSQTLRKLNRASNLPWSCLDFRHSFGSHLAMKGESLYKIATLMGNSPEICRRHYAALMPESLVDSVEFTPFPQRKTFRCLDASRSCTSSRSRSTAKAKTSTCHECKINHIFPFQYLEQSTSTKLSMSVGRFTLASFSILQN